MDLEKMALFYSAQVKVIPGYSGSPIVDESGQIISIATAIVPEYQKEAVLVSEFAHKSLGLNLPPRIPFFGVKPTALADFIRRATFPKNVGINHDAFNL